MIVVTFALYDNRFTGSPPEPGDWYLPIILSLAYFAVRFTLVLWMLRFWGALGQGAGSTWRTLAVAAWFFTTYSGNLFVVAFAIVATIVGTNRQRADDLEGWPRFGALVLSSLSVFLLMPMAHEPIVLGVFGLGPVDGIMHSSQYSIAESAPVPALWIAFFTRPLAIAALSMLAVLWFANLSLFVRLIVPRIQLKGMRLNPRFNLIYVLMLPVPALLLLLSLGAALYYGAGMNKASIARNLLDEKVDDLVHALAFPVASLREGKQPASVVTEWDVARRAEDAFFVRDRESLLAVSGFVASPPAWESILPDTLDRVGGIYYRDEKLWLGAGERVDSSRTVEAFRPIDQEFIRHLGDRVGADLSIEARTGLRITDNGLSFSSNHWGDFPYAARTEAYDTTRANITNAANTFLLVGDWLHEAQGPRGGIGLSVQTDPGRIVNDWLGGGAFIHRAGPLIGTLLLIGVLLGIAVNVAAGIGRGLVRGVLGDLDRLTEGVERFGRGEFESRVAIDGQDEVADLAHSFNRMAENIRENQAQLLEKERLEADLAVARKIQARLLPQSSPVVGSLDVAGISIPSREVGGDLFSYLHLPSGFLGVAIGDVSGKSVPAALLMSNVLAALRSEANHTEHANESMGNMNRIVSDQVDDQFVTFFYGVIDPRTGRLLYACAGHNPTLVVSRDGTSRWLSQAGLPLGVMPDSQYELYEDKLQPGDALVLYSDGVTEACDEAIADEAELEFYGEDRLVESVASNREALAAVILHGVLDDVAAFTRGAQQSDDVTLVVVKYSPPV